MTLTIILLYFLVGAVLMVSDTDEEGPMYLVFFIWPIVMFLGLILDIIEFFENFKNNKNGYL